MSNLDLTADEFEADPHGRDAPGPVYVEVRPK